LRNDNIARHSILFNQNHAHVDNADGELNHMAALHKIF
jgi:hypothetical protein